MAATGKKITRDQIDKHTNDGTFMKAVGTGVLRLTGNDRKKNVKYWNRPGNENIVYNLTSRLAGTEEDVRKVMADSNLFTPDQINESFRNNTITFQNFEGRMANAFDEEIARAKAITAGKEGAAKSPYTLDSLHQLVAKLDITPGSLGVGKTRSTSPKTTTGAATTAATPRKATGSPRGAPLLSRVEAVIGTDSVIDVSRMNHSLTGAAIMKRPGPTSKKKEISGVPMISNNGQSYGWAIDGMVNQLRASTQDHRFTVEQLENAKRDFFNLYGSGPELIQNPSKASASPKGKAPAASKGKLLKIPIKQSTQTTEPTTKRLQPKTKRTQGATQAPPPTASVGGTERKEVGIRRIPSTRGTGTGTVVGTGVVEPTTERRTRTRTLPGTKRTQAPTRSRSPSPAATPLVSPTRERSRSPSPVATPVTGTGGLPVTPALGGSRLTPAQRRLLAQQQVQEQEEEQPRSPRGDASDEEIYSDEEEGSESEGSGNPSG